MTNRAHRPSDAAGVAARLPRPGRAATQGFALAAAAALAANGARILNDSPRRPVAVLDNFDAAMPWLGAALLLTLLAAWGPTTLRLPPVPRLQAAAAFARAHRVEIALFVLILAFGVFMRVFRFGGALPPSDGLCCEEHINGGIAYSALHGDRPLAFPLGRWASAAGFLIFGEDTLGLRFFFPVMGVATLAIFYLLLRQLVSLPVALFGLALYAAAWWPSLRSRQASEGIIYAVLFTLLLVRGLKTRSPLAFFGAGAVGGLMSYEYEPFRAVPLFGAAFLLLAASREVLFRPPVALAAARQRALRLLRLAWWPALIALFAAGIVLVPLSVGLSHGHDLYLTSVHRQEADREGLRLASEWEEQAKWAAELFLPAGPKDYPTSPPRDVAGTLLLDPLTSLLALGGLAAGAVFALRGVRGFFVLWFLASMAAGALVLEHFEPWKFLSLVPVLLVLAALFVEDLRTLALRAYGALGGRVLEGALIAGALFSFWWNADTLFNDVANAQPVQVNYGRENGLVYGLCDYLRGRGDDNYTVAFADVRAIPGLAAPHGTRDEQGRAWGDYIWACHDLAGAAVPAPEELWPLRDLPGGAITLAVAGPSAPPAGLIELLNTVYPGLGAPTTTLTGPGGGYTVLAYELPGGSALAHGLYGEYFAPGESRPAGSRVDLANDLNWREHPAPLRPPFTVRWRGLIYIERAGRHSVIGGAGPTQVHVDGRTVHEGSFTGSRQTFIELTQGWHVIEIELEEDRADVRFSLTFLTPDGLGRPVRANDIVPLTDLPSWVHERGFGVPGAEPALVTQRLDFEPHYSLANVAKLVAGQGESFLTEERWRAVWELQAAGEYAFEAQFLAGELSLVIDGETIATAATADEVRATLQARVSVEAGRHVIELVQTFPGDVDVAGAVVSVTPRSEGAEPFRVRPY